MVTLGKVILSRWTINFLPPCAFKVKTEYRRHCHPLHHRRRHANWSYAGACAHVQIRRPFAVVIQVQIYGRQGIDPDRSTLAAWV